MMQTSERIVEPHRELEPVPNFEPPTEPVDSANRRGGWLPLGVWLLFGLLTVLVLHRLAAVYVLATGALCVAWLLSGLWQQRQAILTTYSKTRSALWSSLRHLRQGRIRGQGRHSRNAPLIRQPQMVELQAQLEATEAAHQQLKTKYREVTNLHHDMRAQITRLRAAEPLFEAGMSRSTDDEEGNAAFTRVLRLVMETVGAGSAVLWLRPREGDTLAVQMTIGRMKDSDRLETISRVHALTTSELRARCETELQRATPPFLPIAVSRLETGNIAGASVMEPPATEWLGGYTLPEMNQDGHPIPDREPIPGQVAVLSREAADLIDTVTGTEFTQSVQTIGILPDTAAVAVNTASAVGVVMLWGDETDGKSNGKLLGVIGVRDPRGQSRFLASERERLQSLSRPLAMTIANITQRVEIHQRLRDVSLLHALPALAQGATDSTNVYQAIVEQVMHSVPCENCTLFLLDGAQERLVAKATQGRVVNLLEHVAFDRGHGVSGWVAAHGRALHIADLLDEPDLLDVERIPPRVRSFAALPLRVEGAIVGVLNVSHAQPHAFTAEDMRVLTVLAQHAALALEKKG